MSISGISVREENDKKYLEVLKKHILPVKDRRFFLGINY